MSGVVAQGVALVLNGFDISCFFTSIEPKFDADIKDTTALCSTGFKTYLQGLINRVITGNGFFAFNSADDTLSIKKLFETAISQTVDQIISIGPLGATQGNPAILLNTKLSKLDVQEKVGDLIQTSFEASATNDGSLYGFGYGVWLYQATVSGSGNGTTFDNTLTSLTGYLVNVHNSEADGTLSGKVQHSTDGSTWVDLVTVTTLAKNTATQSGNISTPVRRYWRWITTGIGGTTNKVSVAVQIGYAG